MNVNYAQLVKKARAGDQDAMTDLYAETSQQVYFAALKLVGNQPDAEDIASETYITAFSNLEKLAEPAAFPKWVRVIAVNLAKDFLKKKKPIIFETDEEEERVLSSVPEESEDCLPEVFAERRELRRQVVELIDELPEAQRATVYLHYMEGHSVEEVAEIMEVNENTVKSRLNYARSKLRKLAERSGLTLSAVSVITLILREECKATAVPFAVNKAVMGAIGTVSAAAAAAGTTAAGTAAAAAGATAAAETAAVGLGAKIAALPIVTKIVAAVAAVGIVVGAGAGINAVKDNGADITPKDPHEAFIEAVEEHGGLESFLGMTGEEIKAVLGEEHLNEDEFSIYYYFDDTVGFSFNEPISTGIPCLNVYSFSETLPILDVHGFTYEETLEFISKIDGCTWTEGEVADFDRTFSVYADSGEFVIYLYVGNLRYAILTDEDGFVNHISVTDYVLYDEIINGADIPAGETDVRPTFTVLEDCDPVGMLNMTVEELFGRYGETYVSEEGTYVQYEYNGDNLNATITDGKISRVYADNLPVKDRFGLEDGMDVSEAIAILEKDERVLECYPSGSGVDFRTANAEYRISFRDGGVQFHQIIAGDFDYDYDALYGAVSGFPGTETGRLRAELTGDRIPELVVVSKNNENGVDRGYITVYTVIDGVVEQIWQTYTSTVHSEARTYYLYNDGTRDYILDCVYYLNQGQINYSYLVHGLTKYGSEQNFWRGKLDGDLSVYEDDIPAFMEKVNYYVKDSILLLDGQQYDLYVYGDSSAGEDGNVEIILTGEFEAVSGGIKAKAYAKKYVYLTDSELRSLKVGDVVDLTYAGYGKITVEKVEIDGNYAEIEEYGDHLYKYQDGNWYFEYPSDVRYSYTDGITEIIFPDGLKITDWSSGNGMNPDMRDDVRDIPSWAYGNGMSVTVKDGKVTEATLNFQP